MIDLSPQSSEREAHAATMEWLKENLPEDHFEAAVAGDWPAVQRIMSGEKSSAAWFSRLGESGLASPTWPQAYGGLGLSAQAAGGVADALFRYQAGRPMTDFVGLMLGGPTILAHGTEEQKQRFLGPLARAEHRWCQLFSEPGAGSDLAGLSTRAEQREDGTWVVNGQKVWSSFAHISDFGLLMARTDPSVPKHRGITYFLVDMRTPGVGARPLKQMTGDAEFNEVFLTDVVLPADALLGEINGGWTVALTTLMQERSGLTGRPAVGPGRSDGLVERAVGSGTIDDPLLRDRLLQLCVEERALQMTTVRAYVESGRKQVGAEGSIRKLVNATIEETVGTLAAEVDPGEALAWSLENQNSPASYDFLAMKMTSIAGGTSEIQRNIIAERVLGLPKDADPEKGVAFSERLRTPTTS